MFHTNNISIAKHFIELITYVETVDVRLDIIVFTECWLGGVGWGRELKGLVMTNTLRALLSILINNYQLLDHSLHSVIHMGFLLTLCMEQINLTC